MLVVADASPLRYLIEVHADGVLPRLYQDVLTTPQVMEELRLEHFPEPVRAWAGAPPQWLSVQAPAAMAFQDCLDDGEASAICLAQERAAGLVLIDERLGTDVAHSVGLDTMGTLGVLREAGARGFLDFGQAIQELMRTRFRCTAELIDAARRQYEDLRRKMQAQRDQGERREP